MVFHSVGFVLFFVVVLTIFFAVPGRWQWAWLLAASLYFYALWNPLLLVHALAIIGATWWIGLRIERETDKEQKRRWCRYGIVLLVANLFVFKYTAFVNDSVRSVFDWVGLAYPVPEFHILLPIGISFYTFQLIGYLVDVARGTKAERHFGIFTLFALFFAKVISGPIERAKNLLPQLHVAQVFDSDRVAAGLRLMLWGTFQKLVIADQLAPAVAIAYGDPHAHSGVVLAAATWFFAFQVYFDFAGYTNIALGAAQTLGYRLLPNFNRPYFATSIQDFWKRWHISLTSWLTDYVYNTLVRIKVKIMKWLYWMLFSLFLTFFISGLWHGAQWTFVAWGSLHGVYLLVSTLSQKWRVKVCRSIGLLQRPTLHARVKVVITFSLVCIAYVFFRADSLADAAYIFSHLHTGWTQAIAELKTDFGTTKPNIAIGLAGAAFALTLELLSDKKPLGEWLDQRPRWVRWSTYYAGIVSILLLGALVGGAKDFIYVRF